jgi:hypothetical protein
MQQFVVFLHHPTPQPPNATIVQRITLAILLFVIAPHLGIADTILNSNTSISVHGDESLEHELDLLDEGTLIGCPASIPAMFANQELLGQQPFLGDPRLLSDRIWVINTRSLTSEACAAPLTNPGFKVSQLDHCGNGRRTTIEELLGNLVAGRPVLIHVHGNRMDEENAKQRGMFVYRNTVPHCQGRPIDFLIFSWPSERQGILLTDGRAKANRTDAEGLYLAWVIRELIQRDVPVVMIGFSFGGRIATGALHAIAGGTLGGRTLPGEHRVGANVKLGLIAPALEDDWLRSGSYHGLATQNIERMSILYNRRDAVLKRYWLLDTVRGSVALGYTGPRQIGPRVDGSPMPLSARDCSPTLGIRHDEIKYYTEACRAGKQMALLLDTTP